MQWKGGDNMSRQKVVFGVINTNKKRVYALSCKCACDCTGYSNAIQMGKASGYLSSGAKY
jgi:hypothetical protein